MAPRDGRQDTAWGNPTRCAHGLRLDTANLARFVQSASDMTPYHFFVLRFRSRRELENAFARLMESPEVATCTIEPSNLEIQLLAPVREARPLIEAIYLEGGLVWSSSPRPRSEARELRRARPATALQFSNA